MVRIVVTGVGKRIPFVLRWARTAAKATRGFSYTLQRMTTSVDQKVVVFESYQGRSYSCSPRAIYLSMCADERFDDHEFVWAFRHEVRGMISRVVAGTASAAEVATFARDFGAGAAVELQRATIVEHGDSAYYQAFARAGHWICNSIVPTHMRPRSDQTYVQCWHGTPFKRLGCDIIAEGNAMFAARDINERYTAEGERADYFLSPSRFATERFTSAFDLAGGPGRARIVEQGYPRNDRLVTATADDAAGIRARLGIPEGKTVVLYAPTWRDDKHVAGRGYSFSSGVDFDGLARDLSGDHVILFRAHYLIADSFDFERFGGFVIDGSTVSDINDLYLVSDILVTDYSSVFFDFANTGRSMVFYLYDLERYADELRGLYFGIEELPGPVVHEQAALVDAIRAAGAEPDPRSAEKLDRFRERFAYLDDGHASDRVIDVVFGLATHESPGSERP